MAWKFDPQGLTDSDKVSAEWQRALAAKGGMEPAQWAESVTQLRSLAAALRDALLPMSPHHTALVSVVEDMSKHLPERRGPRRDPE